MFTNVDYLESALALSGLLPDIDQCRDWIDSRRNTVKANIEPIPFSDLQKWYREPDSGDFVHESGRFFSITGLKVWNWPDETSNWFQPVINQNEFGFLGFIVTKVSGVLHLLVQAKIEPGNLNVVQLSPTVQATRSNFTQVHGGRLPRYLEYFRQNDSLPGTTRLDQLQSEQGSRFLDKLNRNLIVEVESTEDIEISDDHCWMTLGQIKALAREDNTINMDSRSVISCIDPCSGIGDVDFSSLSGFGKQVADSYLPNATAENADHTVRSWIAEHRFSHRFDSQRVPLNQVENWTLSDDRFCSEAHNFSVIATNVEIENREVVSWTQPMMRQNDSELFGFVTQIRKGTLHFLAHLKSEVGLTRKSEIGPTVQCCIERRLIGETADSRRFLPLFSEDGVQIHIDVMQSEEGGRFYQEQNRNIVIQIPEDRELELTSNFMWLTLRQLADLLTHSNYLNIQARSVLSLLDFNSV